MSITSRRHGSSILANPAGQNVKRQCCSCSFFRVTLFHRYCFHQRSINKGKTALAVYPGEKAEIINELPRLLPAFIIKKYTFLRAKPRPIADPNGGSASAPKVRCSFRASKYPRPYLSTTTQIQPTSEVTSILLAADNKKHIVHFVDCKNKE